MKNENSSIYLRKTSRGCKDGQWTRLQDTPKTSNVPNGDKIYVRTKIRYVNTKKIRKRSKLRPQRKIEKPKKINKNL
jgi:hypothetical protein